MGSDARMDESPKKGFAAMSVDRRREIASRGGKAVHQKGTGHQFTAETAASAGRLGGLKVSRDRAHMAAIGQMGGNASRESKNRTPGRFQHEDIGGES